MRWGSWWNRPWRRGSGKRQRPGNTVRKPTAKLRLRLGSRLRPGLGLILMMRPAMAMANMASPPLDPEDSGLPSAALGQNVTR
jgi:hypothetical protein